MGYPMRLEFTHVGLLIKSNKLKIYTYVGMGTSGGVMVSKVD